MAYQRFKHNTIALVYDFDGTLSPKPMQEYTILPEIGIKNGKKFWTEVKRESIKAKGEDIVTYMRLMIHKSRMVNYPVKAEKFRELAKKIEYFPGVKNYFARISKFVQDELPGIKLRHYLLSAGLKEIIEGTDIAHHFHKIFASEYYYDEYGGAIFPNVIVNDTLKTQFIFRINKGREELHENINEYMREVDRPIPIENMLYIGDGLTDVPCMTVIRKNKGYSIAVYKAKDPKGRKVCKELLKAERVDFIANADYRENSELDKLIKLLLHNMAEAINYGKESFRQYRKYLK